jgi:predicted dehydrogenase
MVTPHLIDHQLGLLGYAPQTIAARMHTFELDSAEHYVDLQMAYPAGLVSRIEVLRDPVVDLPKWTVYGTKGTICVPSFTRLELRVEGREAVIYEDLVEVRGSSRFYEQLGRAILDGGPPPVDPREAVAGVRVMELAHQSALVNGQPLDFSWPCFGL